MSEDKNRDFVKENLDFLRKNDYFMFDTGDEDEIKLMEHKLSVAELAYISWCRHIYADVVHLNKSKIIGVGGSHRSGKSIFACTQAYIWDKTFFPRMKERVVHTPQAFAEEVQYVKDHKIHGATFVIDEGGVVAPSDSFYEQWYKQLNQSIQIMGYLNPIIIFCAVIRDNVGTKFRKLYNIQCKAKRFNNMFARIKILDLNYDDLRGRTTPKRPILRIFGKKHILNNLRFGKPPKFIEDKYKSLSLPAKDKLLDKMLDIQRRAPTKAKTKREILRDEQMKFIDEKVYDVVSKFEKLKAPRSKPNNITLDAVKIQYEFQTTLNTAQILKVKAEGMLNKRE